MTDHPTQPQEAQPQEAVTPAKIVAEARTWLRTRWRHQGRVKRNDAYPGAVDCVGLLVGVARGVGLSSLYVDQTNYPPSPDGVRLRATLEALLRPYPNPAELVPGLVLLFRRAADSFPCHVGLTGSYPGGGVSLIHAYIEAWAVVEHRLDESWENLIVGVYCFPGVDYSSLT